MEDVNETLQITKIFENWGFYKKPGKLSNSLIKSTVHKFWRVFVWDQLVKIVKFLDFISKDYLLIYLDSENSQNHQPMMESQNSQDIHSQSILRGSRIQI